jgi:hypothetical protein
MKFNVGDKVRMIGDSNSTPFKRDSFGTTAIVFRVDNCPYPYILKDINGNKICWRWRDSELELVKEVQKDKIVITQDGKTTTATLYRENGTKEVATAKCSPEDTFDFNVGAKLAMERLMEKVEPKKAEPPKPKYYNGKVVCVKSGYKWWTVGKVYEVVDGYITANDGCRYPNGIGRLKPYIDADDVRHAGHGDNDCRHNNRNEFIELVM